MIIGNKKAVNAFDDSIRATSFKVGSFAQETASIAYDGTLLPAGTASYAGISIDATKRYLKNSGKDKTPALVESGQGKFFNGTNQYINTGIIPNQSQGTLVTRFTYVSGMVSRCVIGSVSASLWVNASGKIEGVFGDAIVTSTDTLITTQSYHISLTWNGLVATLKVNNITKATNTATAFTPTNVMYLGARNNAGTPDRYFNNVIDETYCYDVALSDAQIGLLYSYPEKVKAYNGAIVPDIGSEANCKLFLPLCENSGSNVYNMAISPLVAIPLVNYTTAMHTSAAKLSYGAQCTAWKRDSLGVLLGMSNGLSFDGGVSVKQVAIDHTLAYNTQYVIEAILPYNSSATEGGIITYPFYMRASGSSIYLRMDNYNASVAVNSGYHHAVIKYDGTTRTMNCWIDGAQRLTDVVVTKTTDYGLLSFVVGTLGISSNIKVYRLANYSKFDILKSWNKATKKINILNNISGWDVFVLAGQSNMVGISTPVDPILDATDNMIWQYGSTDKTLVIATEPLDHYGGSTANSIGLGLTFAKLYKQSVNNGRGVLLIPCAFGGTGFSNNYWTLGGVCRESMVSVSNIVMKMSNVSLKAVLWNQGEADAGLSQSAYEVHLDGFIDDMRSRILGASSVPFVLGKVHSSSSAYNAGIATATINTPTRKQLVSVVTDTDTLVLLGDNLHYDSASLRTLGQRYLTKYQEIVGA